MQGVQADISELNGGILTGTLLGTCPGLRAADWEHYYQVVVMRNYELLTT